MANDRTLQNFLAPRFPLNLLLVEDNPDDAELCLRMLKKAQFDVEVDVVRTEDEFASRLRTATYDVILADYNLGTWTGMDALNLLHKDKLDIPLILVTGHLGDEAAVECVKNGAADYILKDRMERLPVAIHRAIEERAARNERQRGEDLLEESEAKFRLMTEAIPVAVFVEQNTQCTYANRAATRITGYSHQELLGISFCELIPSESRSAVAKCLTDSFERTEPTSSCGEAPILTKTHQERWLDITVSKLAIKTKFAALITALDITDRKHREEESGYLIE